MAARAISDFRLACLIANVDQATLAVALDVAPATVESWWSGRRTPGPFAWDYLRERWQTAWGADNPSPFEAAYARARARLL